MRRLLILLFALVIVAVPADASSQPATENGLEIYVFRVGQADSMLFVGPAPNRKTLLVDLGVSRHLPFTGGSTAQHVAERIFEITGRRHLDYFLLTHFHSDHFGGERSGITALIEDHDFTVGTVIDTGGIGSEFVNRTPGASAYRARLLNWASGGRISDLALPRFGSDQIELGSNVEVEIVAFGGRYADDEPSVHQAYEASHPGHYARSPASENDLSIAFEVSLGNFEFWTGGDLSGAHGDGTSALSGSSNNYTNVETPMVARWRRDGRESDVEIYRANHHGSRYSTTPQLLAALDPEIVLYSAHSGHRHPSFEVVDRVRWTARQYATGLDSAAWGNGSRFRYRRGRVPGEIQIMIAADGSSYRINGAAFRSWSDAEERANLDAAVQ